MEKKLLCSKTYRVESGSLTDRLITAVISLNAMGKVAELQDIYKLLSHDKEHSIRSRMYSLTNAGVFAIVPTKFGSYHSATYIAMNRVRLIYYGKSFD